LGEVCEYCKVPLHYEAHDAQHKIKEWNESVFQAAKEKSMQEFEKRLPKKSKKKEDNGWSSLPM